MKHKLAKIFSLLSLIMMIWGAISAVIFFNHNVNVFGDPSFYEWILIFSVFLGWIPTLIFSVLGIVFSRLAKKEKKNLCRIYFDLHFVGLLGAVVYLLSVLT